jgi:hypothetical protein
MWRVLALVAVLVVAGCGGSSSKPNRLTLTTPKVSPAPSESSATSERPITLGEKNVVRGWSDALRHGDVEGAVDYWAVPATAWNGGDQPVRLLTRAAVRFFNKTLPCGARAVAFERDANYVLATFVLTERPGPGRCGTGTGHRARVLFLVRGGKIVQWLRATDPPSGNSS